MSRLITRAIALAIPLLVSASAFAATDKRAVDGASSGLEPIIPEPSSILLYAAGLAVVGWGVSRIRSRGR